MSGPWLQDPDLEIWHGDALDVLRGLPDASVHMCATSPPFYGLRDYGVDGQIGLEETPDEWVARLVDVFREVRRVLRDDGTLWVEIGDSYNAGTGAGRQGQNGEMATRSVAGSRLGGNWKNPTGGLRVKADVKVKDLLGQPWMLAFALRADGWYLRSEIIWSRPNPMPESVTDRPTKAHSTVFLLSKIPRYFFDADAKGTQKARLETQSGGDGTYDMEIRHAGANARSVWTIPTQPTPFAHFATFPEELVRRMILAGTSEKGCCPECGAPWVRDIEVKGLPRDRGENGAATVRPDVDPGNASHGRNDISGAKLIAWREANPPSFKGWLPSCPHDHPAVPCTVLDPFGGSGTTALVARKHGRHSVLVELNETYCALAASRLSQLSLLTGKETG